MQMQTLKFGELEYQEQDIIVFTRGLLGFPGEDRFILLRQVVQAPFMWLQSLRSSQLAFVVLDPWLVDTDYHLELTDEVKNRLQIHDASDVMTLGITVITEDPQKMTINLRAPLLVNVKSHLGEQVILSDDKYSVRHQIFSSR